MATNTSATKTNVMQYYTRKFWMETSEAIACNYFYTKVVTVDKIADVQNLLVGFKNGLSHYNTACIFINNYIEENLELLQNYVKQTVC